VLGGVAAGIADHFAVNPLLVRLAFVVAAFFGGIGVIAYVVGWIVLPSATPGEPPAPRDNRQLLGFGLVALGLATIPNGVGFGWSFNGAFWPLALVTLGGTVLWLRTRDDRDEPPDPPPAPPPAAASSASSALLVTATPGTAPMESVTTPAPAAPRAARREKPPRGPVTAITLSALLILGGVVLLVAAAGWSSVDLGVVAAIALTIVGAGLVVSAWIGRARGLVVLGIVLALVVGAFGAIDVPIQGGIGEATYRPGTQAGVREQYRMAIGRLELDFRQTALAGHRTEVDATVGIGRLVVRIPDDVRLVVHGHAGIGSVSLLGRDRGDCCPNDEDVVRPGEPGRGTLVLDARVGAGAVDVTTTSDITSTRIREVSRAAA
jgi:phage shock protein PspC (stress-responsive transcriptional regulator)